jgi:glycosyltransferase involved in cell wall biosynthesis
LSIIILLISISNSLCKKEKLLTFSEKECKIITNILEKKRFDLSKVVVLIPCYNESMTIEKVVTDFKQALPSAEVYVYDNNSTDNTDIIAKNAGATVRYEYRQGKGNVIRSVFRDIDADCYLMIDGDDTYPAEHAAEMVKLVLEKKADMVIGDRLSSTYFTENKRLFHNTGNKLVRFFINKLFKNEVKDIMTGYRAFSPLFAKSFPILSQGFEIETEMTIFALDKNFLICEVPVNYRDRPEGSVSKLNTFSDGIRVLKTIFNLFRNYKPFLFFSLAAVMLAIFAIILFIPVFIEYLKTDIVPRLPTLVVSCVLFVMSLLLWVSGLILQSISLKHRQLFEILLNEIAGSIKRNKERDNV